VRKAGGEGNGKRRDKSDERRRDTVAKYAVSERKRKGKKNNKNARDGCSVAPRVLEQKGAAS
jgi:hypothetical protein